MNLESRERRLKHHREYYQRNKERLKLKKKEYELKNKQNIKDRKREYYIKNKEKLIKYRLEHPDITKKSLLNQRIKALRLVSEAVVCVRCGCDDYRLLEINHKNGGGNKEFTDTGRCITTRILTKQRHTNDLEILCKPCNAIHYLERKYGEIGLKVIFTQKRKVIIEV